MLEFEFAINNRIEILWEDGTYKSHVQDIGDDFVAISIPAKEGKFLPLKAGERVEVVYYGEREVYQFNTLVAGRKIDRIAMIVLKLPSKVQLVQRRDYIRISCLQEVPFIKLKEGLSKELLKVVTNDTSKFKSALLVDLGGGGIKLKMDEEMKPGECIMAHLHFISKDLFIYGKMMRVFQDEDNRYVCGIKFNELDNKDFEKIIQYIFKLMREQRKKGLKEE